MPSSLKVVLGILSLQHFLSLAHASILEERAIVNTDFLSAIEVNVCQEDDGGYGFGRVTYETNSCECLGPNKFRAYCKMPRPNPSNPGHHVLERDCDPRSKNVVCLPTEDSDMLNADCACQPIQTKKGSKPPGDTDGIACSGGVKFAKPGEYKKVEAIDVDSLIMATTQVGLQGCYVQQGADVHEIASHYPCENVQDKLRFFAHESYQACIEGNDNTPQRINFDWIIRSPLGRKRDGTEVHDLASILQYDHSVSTKGWQGGVVLVDQDGEELLRLK